MARDIHFAETSTQTTSTSTTVVATNASVTFTPDASTSYYVIAHAVVSTTSTSADFIKCSIQDNSAGVYIDRYKLCDYATAWKDTSDKQHLAGFYRVSIGASPSSYTFRIGINRPSGTGTATFESGSIAVIKAAAADLYVGGYASTNSATYADLQTVTGTTSGDTVVIASSSFSPGTSAVGNVKAVFDSTDYGECVAFENDGQSGTAKNNQSWMVIKPYSSLSSSSRTYKVQALLSSGLANPGGVTNILALSCDGSELSLISGSTHDETDYTTTSSSYSTVGSNSISRSTGASSTAILLSSTLSNNDQTGRSHRQQVTKGGTLWGAYAVEKESNNGGSTATYCHGFAGFYTGTGSSVTLTQQFAAEAGAGNTHTVYASSFVMMELTQNTAYSLAADAGSYTYTGQAASIAYGRTLTADAGSYTYTGLDPTINRDINLAADAGSYNYSGLDAGLQRGWSLATDAGTYTYSGLDATFSRGKALAADAGSYTYTGLDATFTRAINLATDAGTYTYSGLDATINRGLNLAADAGTYTYTGLDPAINRGINLSVDAGSYTFTGFDVTIDYVSTGTATETTDVAGPPKLVKRSAYEDRDKKRKALKDAIDRAMNPETPQDEAADAIAEVAEIAEIAMPDLPAAPFSEMLAVMATMDREINRAYQRAIDDAVAVILLSME